MMFLQLDIKTNDVHYSWTSAQMVFLQLDINTNDVHYNWTSTQMMYTTAGHQDK